MFLVKQAILIAESDRLETLMQKAHWSGFGVLGVMVCLLVSLSACSSRPKDVKIINSVPSAEAKPNAEAKAKKPHKPKKHSKKAREAELAALNSSQSPPSTETADEAKPKGMTITETMKKGAEDVGSGFSDAISSPLVDLNLKRTEIPPVLQRAIAKTYNVDGMDRCEVIAAEVGRLDEVLGPDFDEPPPPPEFSNTTERGGKMASDAALGAVSGAATDIIPFRGMVRWATGAEKHRKLWEKARSAGNVRRAYLKGIGMNKNCAPPAAPSWYVPKSTVINETDLAPKEKSRKSRPVVIDRKG
jgi:hypothetical protein